MCPYPLPTTGTPAPAAGSMARKLFSCDKGIKIAWTDGKHFAERSAEKKGNEAVKKIEHGAGRRRGGNIPFAAAGDLAEAARFFPRCTRVPQLGLKAGRAPRRASNPRQQGDREDFALHSAPAHLMPRACGSQAALQTPREMHLTQTHVHALLPSVTAPGLHCVFLTWLIRGADSLWRRTLIPFVGCFSWQPLFTQSGPPHSGKGIKTAESQPGTTGTGKQVLALTGIYHLFWWMNNIRAHIRPLKQTIFASHFFEYWLFEGQNENSEVHTSHEQEQAPFSGIQEKWQGPCVFQGNIKVQKIYHPWTVKEF